MGYEAKPSVADWSGGMSADCTMSPTVMFAGKHNKMGYKFSRLLTTFCCPKGQA